ncbi:MAG: 16S rRNA (guanine(966)-N(2))-methyltransferase RsmD [Clostridia bacterium]|nr:16S rRNA (guanine(966)-N(2))-methyltransferase RsmD [Clostridia bacterium]
MRIISGTARGRILTAPAGEETRPTADKIRGALFNILGSRVYDAEVLDLFGGTGALTLEALSRGAAHGVISDSSREAVKAITKNAEAVLKTEKDARLKIYPTGYRSAIDAWQGKPFDLVFLDPPYRMLEAYADAITRLEKRGLITDDTLIIAERAREKEIVIPDNFERVDVRFYGVTAIEFIRRIGRQEA